MEYVYAAMLLHKANKTIDEASLKKVLESAGIKADDGRVKALVAALDGVDIKEAIASAAVATAAPAAASTTDAPVKEEKKKEEKKKEEQVDEGAAAAGLGALFG